VKEFIKKLTFLLVLPFSLYLLLVVLIDPYNYFNISGTIKDEIKLKTSRKLYYQLWNIIDYKRNPTGNILIGDSKIDRIDIKSVEQTTGRRYYKFSYAAATLPDIIDTFWFASNLTELKNVYIGINFDVYNSYINVNRFSQSQAIIENPLLYSVDKTVLTAMYYNLYSQYIDSGLEIGIPDMERNEFWKSQLNERAPSFYQSYKYPADYYDELKRIAAYCREHKINLVFIIMPTHVELQRRVGDFGLDDELKRYKEDMKDLGLVYDFDYDNRFTKDKDNFDDPYHCTDKAVRQVISEVWGNDIK